MHTYPVTRHGVAKSLWFRNRFIIQKSIHICCRNHRLVFLYFPNVDIAINCDCTVFVLFLFAFEWMNLVQPLPPPSISQSSYIPKGKKNICYICAFIPQSFFVLHLRYEPLSSVCRWTQVGCSRAGVSLGRCWPVRAGKGRVMSHVACCGQDTHNVLYVSIWFALLFPSFCQQRLGYSCCV